MHSPLTMVPHSHSTSASFSSLSFSRTSDHTATTSSSSSSPQSSPSSSPDFAVHNTNLFGAPKPPPIGRCVSGQRHHERHASPSSPASAIVPFSWEEKPGIIKKEIMQTSWCHEHHADEPHHAVDERRNTPAPLSTGQDELDMCTQVTQEEHSDLHLQKVSYKHQAKTPASRQPKTFQGTGDLPRIRPPPCLSHASDLHAKKIEGNNDKRVLHATVHQQHQTHRHHSGGSSAASVGSKLMASISLHKRGHHRSTPSLEDDPFWLAMVACTNDAENDIQARRKCSKRFLPVELSRTDSQLARRLQESIHLDQCMPRKPLENCTMSRKAHNSRGGHEARAMDDATRYSDVEDVSSGVKCSSRRVHHMHTDVHPHDEAAGATAARLGSKAVKALSLARSELHGRCKSISKQERPPVVDISCSSRGRGTKSKREVGSKHRQLPDLFGCKSNNDLILVSRFP